MNKRMNKRQGDPTQARYWTVIAGLACMLAAVLPLGLVLGAADYPLATLAAALVHGSAGRDILMILWDLRMPRLLLALMIGAHLAVSGLILQAALRNPLAESSVFGVASGATCAVMTLLLIVSFSASLDSSRLEAYDMSLVPAVAQLGGVGAVLAVYALSWRRGTAPFRLILMGVAVSAALYALAMTILAGGGRAASRCC